MPAGHRQGSLSAYWQRYRLAKRVVTRPLLHRDAHDAGPLSGICPVRAYHVQVADFDPGSWVVKGIDRHGGRGHQSPANGYIRDGSSMTASVSPVSTEDRAAPGDWGRIPVKRPVSTVSAIVVTYWTGPALAECLNALAADPALSEIIIVNNGNDRDTLAWLERYCRSHHQFRLLDPGRNTGFAVGCNYGVASATGDFIALVNPDLIVPPGAIAQFLDVFERDDGIWLCGGRLEHPDGTEQRGGRRDILSPWRAFVELARLDRLFPRHPYFRRLHLHEGDGVGTPCEVPTVSGAFMIMPRRVYQRLGGMDDNMFMHFEDADLCIRIRQHGGKVFYCGNIPVSHHLSTSDVSRLFVEWHKTRSTAYYFFKHFTQTYPHWLILLVSVLLHVRLALLAPHLLIRDIPGILRRFRHGRRGTHTLPAAVPERLSKPTSA